jgi:hypothetical protein
MGTRGTWGFVLDGREKLTYNHFDSYPDGLGATLLNWLRDQGLEQLCARVRALELVDESAKPTPEQQERLVAMGTHNPQVSSGQTEEWYSLLRNCQGDPELTLKSGFMIEGADFALDSLFCEWAYVIDLDNQKFEVYRGFQTAPHEDGRFATRVDPARAATTASLGETYYPVRKLVDFSLANLPDAETMVEAVARAERAQSAAYYVIDGQARLAAIRLMERESVQARVVRRDDELEDKLIDELIDVDPDDVTPDWSYQQQPSATHVEYMVQHWNDELVQPITIVARDEFDDDERRELWRKSGGR